MQVSVDLTRADVLRMSLYCLFRMRSNQIAFGFVWLVVFALGFLHTSWPSGAQFLLHRAGVATLVAFIALCAGVLVSVLILLTMRRDSGVLGRHEFRITDEGLLAQSSAVQSLTRWRAIQSIAQTQRWIVIRIGQRGYQMIPCHAFATPADCDAFRAELTERWRTASSAPESAAIAPPLALAPAVDPEPGAARRSAPEFVLVSAVRNVLA